MVNHTCIKGVLAGSDKYSAPVPVIGLYIAAASAVCSLLILYDIIDAFIKRRRWLPCKLFKLNSVTLSLIGVVVKITVDLTTSMPSALDQLSKLAGTTSLCIYMCCVFPSVGDMKDSTNMFALSILVITDIVNICIQLSTGVIVFFIPEHIAILFIMLLLLLILWHYILTTKSRIKFEVEESRSEFINGFNYSQIFMKRLEDALKDSFRLNPQIKACASMEGGIVGDLSLICFFILVQATIRTIVLKKGNLCGKKLSDYSWSMEAIVATQLATVTIGTFASYARRCTMTTHVEVFDICDKSPVEEPYYSNPIWGRRTFLVCVNFVYIFIVFITYWLLAMPTLLFYFLKSNMTWEFLKEVGLYTKHDVWLQRKINTEVGELREKSKRKSSNLCNLLTEIVPPPQSAETTKRKSSNLFNLFRKNDHPTQSAGNTVNPPRYQGPRPREVLPFRARLLPLVVLVRFVEVAIIPEILSRNIILTFREAFETLHFTEKHMHNLNGKDIKETEVAKAVWMAGDFNHLLPDTLRRSNQYDGGALDRAFRVMEHIQGEIGNNLTDPIYDEIQYLRRLLRLRGQESFSFSSVEELSYFLEDLFVDLIDRMLAQLPEAIFKAVTSSPVDEYEKRVRQSIEHLCKFESWEGITRWKPPKGCHYCNNLLDPQIPDARITEETATMSRNDMLTSEVPAFLPVQ